VNRVISWKVKHQALITILFLPKRVCMTSNRGYLYA
jgi:hypothetical protein